MTRRAVSFRWPVLRTIAADRAGISITEFGLIAPVFMVLLMGALDLGHTLYMRSMLHGVLQKAARDAALETGGSNTNYLATKTVITDQLHHLAKNSTVLVERTSFRDYVKAANPTREPFTDTDGNGTCNNGEPYEDNNKSSAWDIDNGIGDSQGGAQDTVIYSASVSYPRIFPYMHVVGLPDTVTMQASTALVNQPYGDQAPPTIRNCP